MRSHSVTCHPTEVTFLPLPQPKLVLDLATPEGCKAELTWVVVISQDSLPAKYGHLSQNICGVWFVAAFYSVLLFEYKRHWMHACTQVTIMCCYVTICEEHKDIKTFGEKYRRARASQLTGVSFIGIVPQSEKLQTCQGILIL